MITSRFAILLACLIACGGCAFRPAKPLNTAKFVDLSRYAGKWYEIARLPNRFQLDDARATAEYSLNTDGALVVVNTETRRSGIKKSVEGTATVVSGSNGSRLRVKFSGLAGLAPASSEGNYWIISLAPDYSAALVGVPNRKYLWLLARRPEYPTLSRNRYLDIARSEGFDTSKVIIADWPR
ncbi:MAG TPA: lipocalin family protein [Chthoniobacteraceae bacterium]|nr:lipocalin family protein [Chthoniobacteraceae bacterium]